MPHTKPKSMKITRTKVRGIISLVEANDAFVFISTRDKRRLYINVGGTVFHATSETPITFDVRK